MDAQCYRESKWQSGVCKWWVVPPLGAAFCVSPANPERQPCSRQGQRPEEPEGVLHPCSDFQRAVDGECRNWVRPQPGARNRFEPFCARYPDEMCLTNGRPWEGTRLAEEFALVDKALERLADRGPEGEIWAAQAQLRELDLRRRRGQLLELEEVEQLLLTRIKPGLAKSHGAQISGE